MDTYTIYCTEEQTKKAFELGAQIEHHSIAEMMDYTQSCMEAYKALDSMLYQIPTAEQMCGWLREKKGVCIFITDMNIPCCYVKNKDIIGVNDIGYISTYEQAILTAIDVALDYLEKNK